MDVASTPIALGPFDLLAPIGHGGMSTVWRGVHRRQGVPVAVKMMTGERAAKTKFREAFQAEVRAVAGLDHPGVVMVLDQGVLGEGAAASISGVIAGSPYLVMEVASLGTLRDLQIQCWRDLRELLLAVLDPLAHAHACGVVHGDLKPANILICGGSDFRPGPKISDFGVAAAVEDRVSVESIERPVGTPSYMAPEQFAGRWRDYGPWTDLYSLGCVAYELICGHRPFRATNLLNMATQHMTADAPRMEALYEVPEAMEAWVRRAMSKEPGERFQRAADAAWALLSLPKVKGRQRGRTFPMWSMAAADGTAASTTIGFDLLMDELATVSPEAALSTGGPITEGRGAAGRPPLPHTWRQSSFPVLPPSLVDVGLGLWGVRQVPFVGREDERDVLWDALRWVGEEQRARVVFVDGPAGVGKSRLAEWVCRRAHEVGAATVMRATHPTGAGGRGLGPMVARYLRCHGLPHARALHRVRRLLHADGIDDEYEFAALAAVVAPQDPGAETSTRRVSLEERFATLRRLLGRATRARPLIVWIDDAERGGDAAAFVRQTMEMRDGLPVLFVLSRRTGPGEGRPIVNALLDDLCADPEVRRVSLGALASETHAEFVERLLPLEPRLAEQVVSRTRGNPLFAVQIVGDLIAGEKLARGERGFGLADGARASLPDDLHGLWLRRLRAVMATLEVAHGADGALVPLELAAALGSVVDLSELKVAASVAASPLPPGLVQALLQTHLLELDESGRARFVHGLMRESLLRHARDGGRLRAHHAVCAEALRQFHAGARPERIGYHYSRARQDEKALEPLLSAATERFEAGEYGLALRALDLRASSLRRLDPPPVVDQLGGWVLRARVLQSQGMREEAGQWADRAATLAAESKQRPLMAQALLVLGQLALWAGHLNDAQVYFDKCHGIFSDSGELRGVASALHGLGDVLSRRGDTVAADLRLRDAIRVYNVLGETGAYARVTAQLSLARNHVVASEYDKASRLYVDAATRATATGARFSLAEATNGLGEIYRAQRQFGDARACYEMALDLYRQVGSPGECVPRLNLALVDLLEGRYASAAHRYDELAETLSTTIFWGYVLAGRLPCLASRAEWDAFSKALDATWGALLHGRTTDPDKAWPVELAGELAMQRGEPELAERAFTLASRLWGGLGMDAASARAEARAEAAANVTRT